MELVTKMDYSYAKFFVGYVARTIFSLYNGRKPNLYNRFIHECVDASSSSKEEFNQVINSVNSFHPALNYTREILENSLAFSISNSHYKNSFYLAEIGTFCKIR